MTDQTCSTCVWFQRREAFRLRRCLNPNSEFTNEGRLGIWTCPAWTAKPPPAASPEAN